MPNVNDYGDRGVSLGFDNKIREGYVRFDSNNAWAITPNDAADISPVANSIYVGVTGDVQITAMNGQVIVLKNLVQGEVHRISAKRIWLTNTTATSIVAFTD